MKNPFVIAFSFLLFVLVSCGGSFSSATGRWQSPTTSSGYLWMRLNDSSGSVQGTLGVSTSSGSLSISGTRKGSYLDLASINSSADFYYKGSFSGDTWEANSTVCTSTCSSGIIRFNRTSYSAGATVELQVSPDFLEKVKKVLEEKR